MELKPSDMGFRWAATMTRWRYVGLVHQRIEYLKPSTCSHPDTSTAPCGDARYASTNSAASIHSPVPLITEHTFSYLVSSFRQNLGVRVASPLLRSLHSQSVKIQAAGCAKHRAVRGLATAA